MRISSFVRVSKTKVELREGCKKDELR